MKLIKLTQGKFAQVDDEDFEELNKHEWYAHKEGNAFYAVRHPSKKESVGGVPKTVRMHRILINATPGIVTDHRDGNGLNNQKKNLRNANRLGIKGVYWHTAGKKFEVRIQVGGKFIYLGLFSCLEKAKRAHREAELKYFGDLRAK